MKSDIRLPTWKYSRCVFAPQQKNKVVTRTRISKSNCPEQLHDFLQTLASNQHLSCDVVPEVTTLRVRREGEACQMATYHLPENGLLPELAPRIAEGISAKTMNNSQNMTHKRIRNAGSKKSGTINLPWRNLREV
jgi:hypothetical protein